MEPGESQTIGRMKSKVPVRKARENAKVIQGAASLVGAISTVFLMLAPASPILITIVFVTAIVAIAVGVTFSMSAPAIKWGLVGVAPALLLVLFYEFTAFFGGPP